MNLFRRFRDIALATLLLALPFFFLRANLSDRDRAGPLDRLLLQISAPVQHLGTQLAGGVSGWFSDYVYLVDVKQDADAMRTENAQLTQKLDQLAEVERENQRLKQLLGLRERLGGEALSARVIGRFRDVPLAMEEPPRCAAAAMYNRTHSLPHTAVCGKLSNLPKSIEHSLDGRS